MDRCEMRFPGYDARSNRGLIRWELFLDHDVRDVLLTSRDDTLCVIYRGQPDLIRWAATLIEAGFPTPRFGEVPAEANPEAAARSYGSSR
jgi:hypothetical protein